MSNRWSHSPELIGRCMITRDLFYVHSITPPLTHQFHHACIYNKIQWIYIDSKDKFSIQYWDSIWQLIAVVSRRLLYNRTNFYYCKECRLHDFVGLSLGIWRGNVVMRQSQYVQLNNIKIEISANDPTSKLLTTFIPTIPMKMYQINTFDMGPIFPHAVIYELDIVSRTA